MVADPPADNCGSGGTAGLFDLQEQSRYVKLFNGTRYSDPGAPNTVKYKRKYILTTFVRKNGKTSEIDGKKYDPHVNKTCAVYANIDPNKSGQQINPRTYMYDINLLDPVWIRYIAKHRVRTPLGNLAWFVMVHVHYRDSEPWGFVQASCLFVH